MPPMDIALAYNPALKCCDVVFNGTDFALDTTPASAMLFSLLARRRAKPDDVVPSPVRDWAHPHSLNARGGWAGDALDKNGQLSGSLLWLYERALASEETRNGVEAAVAEAVGWLETIRGLALQISVGYVKPQILGYRVRAGNTAVALSMAP